MKMFYANGYQTQFLFRIERFDNDNIVVFEAANIDQGILRSD